MHILSLYPIIFCLALEKPWAFGYGFGTLSLAPPSFFLFLFLTSASVGLKCTFFPAEYSRFSGAVKRVQDRAKTLPHFPILHLVKVVSSEEMQEGSVHIQVCILALQLFLKAYTYGTAVFIPASLGIAPSL